MDSELNDLVQIFGIDPNQIEVGKGEVSLKFPEYFHDLKIEIQEHIIKVLVWKDDADEHWKLDRKCLQLLFNSYKIVPSYRKVERQFGNCSYQHKRIRLNFGNDIFDINQCRSTLTHEYVHAITKEFYNYSGHGEVFNFYNNLLQMSFRKIYTKRSYEQMQKRLNVKT